MTMVCKECNASMIQITFKNANTSERKYWCPNDGILAITDNYKKIEYQYPNSVKPKMDFDEVSGRLITMLRENVECRFVTETYNKIAAYLNNPQIDNIKTEHGEMWVEL